MGESVFAVLDDLKLEVHPVDLSTAFPDITPPEIVAKPLREAVAKGGDVLMHQYTRGFGHPRLVNAIAALYGELIDRTINPNTEVLVTIGGTEALFCTFMGLVNPGDEVIIIEPFWDAYEPMVRTAGGIPIFIPLRLTTENDIVSAGDWALDPEELASKFSSKTKLIVVNTPHNPFGKVFSKDELTVIADLCKKYDVVAVMDEVYEWLMYGGKKHFRMNTLPGMWERSITIGRSGKAFGVTGYKTGWAYGPANLMRSLRLIHRNAVARCPTPLQEAVAIAIETEIPLLGRNGSYWGQLSQGVMQKRDRFCNFLQTAGLKPIVPEGGYVVIADISLLAKGADLSSFNGTDDFKFAQWLSRTHKLQGLPPSAFYSEEHKGNAKNIMRFCFHKQNSTLNTAEEIIEKILKTMR